MEIKPQDGPQWQFMSTQADIAIYGGSAGSGKSYALLLEPLRNLNNPNFRAVIFRRTSVQVKNAGGLWDESLHLYSQLGGLAREFRLEWIFPSGMTVKFSHLENEKDIYAWQGSQIPLICFDEVTHFTEKQFWYLMSRLRSLSGVSGYIRATCNPDPDSFIRSLIRWYIGEDGFPIADRSGILRWFIRQNDSIIWADSKEELISQYGEDQFPKSFTFIAAKIHDNQILLQKDPAYLSNLNALSRVDRMRLLEGNWNVRESAGLIFRREWFALIETIPGGWIQAVRFWDRACLVADTKVMTDQGEKEIQNIKVNDLVLTRKGFKKVTWSGISKKTNEIISVVFSNGSVISGTSCHPTYTTNRGWVKLAELKGTDKVLWKKSSSTEKDISFSTEENITSTVKGTSTIMNGMTSEESVSSDYCTEMFGNSIMDLFPMAILSTTGMGTELTIKLKILNPYQKKDMQQNIEHTILNPKLVLEIQNIVKKHLQLFQRGCSNLINLCANIAELFSTQKVLKLNIANSAANLIGVPVYDLTVTECPEFFANGILVHNSTKPNESNKDPDWTRGLKLYKYANGTYVVADLKSIRDTPGQVETLVKNVAAHDTYAVTIMSQQDPGSAGVSESEHFIRMLIGYDVRVETFSKDKVTRAKPVSAQCEAGNISVLRAPWNEDFFNELENFPDGNHDDIVDCLSGAFNATASGFSIADAMWGGR